MTHFRFRFKQVGYQRWRWRAAHRRADWRALPVAAGAGYLSHTLLQTAGRRRPTPGLLAVALPALAPATAVLRVGDFEVGEAGDPQLLGHPDIRY